MERIFGEDRYETALKIAKKGIEEGKLNPDKIFLCSGEKSADALSIASVAIKEKGILLLTDEIFDQKGIRLSFCQKL